MLHHFALHIHTYFDSHRNAAAHKSMDATARALGWSAEQVATSDTYARSARRLIEDPADSGTMQALEYAVSPRMSAWSFCLAPRQPEVWPSLNDRWERAFQGFTEDDYIGQVLIFYALHDGGTAVELADEASRAMPGELPLGDPTELFDGCYLWEALPRRDDAAVRTLVVVAPATREAQSDSWLWPDQGSELRQLPSFLWEIAKIRHEARRFLERRDLIDAYRLIERADQFAQSDPSPSGRRAAALRTLHDEAALAEGTAAILRTMAGTVRDCTRNALASLKPWHSAGTTGPIADDLEHADWLAAETESEAATFTEAAAYAKPMARIGTAEIERELRDIGERSELVSVIQNSVLAAVGLLLALAQTLNVTWALPGPAKAPLFLTVALVGLAGPALPIASRPGVRRSLRTAVWLATVGALASFVWLLLAWNDGRWPS